MSAIEDGPQPSGTLLALSPADLERLRRAAGWARFIAIVGFTFSALFALVAALIVTRRLPGSLGISIEIMGAISAAGIAAASILLWAYAQNVAALFTEGEPALARAFRNLRHFFTLWTLTVAFDTITTMVSMLGKH